MVNRDARSNRSSWPLEPDSATVRAWFEELGRRLAQHIDTLPDQDAGYSEDAMPLARALAVPMPEEGGASFSLLLDRLLDDVVPLSFNAAAPGYMGYIPGGGLVHTALADAFSAAVNRYVGVWQAAPGLAQIENTVGDWFCRLASYPDSACGILTTGGSISMLSAIVTAREDRLGDDLRDGVIYVSAEAHHCVTKAARLAGFSRKALRHIAVDDQYRMDVEALREAVDADRRQGLRPFLVVGNAGTTNTGAIDDLDALADVAEASELWFHVDGAYGGFFLMTERGRTRMKGLERSDSLTLDPHKGLFLSYGTGALLVREADHLRRAHSESSDYMPQYQEPGGDFQRFDPCEYGPELSRGVRGLRIWLPFQMHGAQAFREQLDEKLDLTTLAFERLSKHPEIEILAAPQLSVFAFRYRAAGRSESELDRLNRELLDRIMARQRVFLTSTLLDGRFAIRICILSFRTHRDRVEEGVEIIEEEMSRL